jgi:DNA-binding response OmpR family regulator
MAGYDILLLDDGSAVFKTLAWVLAYKGHQVIRAAPRQVLWEALPAREFDLIVAPLALDRAGELEVLKKAKEFNPRARIMVLNAEDQRVFPLDAYHMEIDDYVLLPCSPAELWRRVSACLKRLTLKHLTVSPQIDLAVINERALKKVLKMLNYIRHSLEVTAGDLSLLNRHVSEKIEDSVKQKMQKVSARIDILKALTEGFQREISWQ